MFRPMQIPLCRPLPGYRRYSGSVLPLVDPMTSPLAACLRGARPLRRTIAAAAVPASVGPNSVPPRARSTILYSGGSRTFRPTPVHRMRHSLFRARMISFCCIECLAPGGEVRSGLGDKTDCHEIARVHGGDARVGPGLTSRRLVGGFSSMSPISKTATGVSHCKRRLHRETAIYRESRRIPGSDTPNYRIRNPSVS